MTLYSIETKTLVGTLETPIKITGSSSKGYEQRWAVLALNPLTSSILISIFPNHPLIKVRPTHPRRLVESPPEAGGRTPNPRRFVAKQGSVHLWTVPGVVRPPPAREPAERREAACSPAERRVLLIRLPIRLNKYKNNDYTSNF